MPARKLLPRGRRGCGGHESVVPAMRAGLLRSRLPQRDHAVGHAAAGLHGHARPRGVAAPSPRVLGMPRHMSSYPPRIML